MLKQDLPSPAVAQAIRILDYLGHVRAEAGVSEISRALDIGKSSCFHILTTLTAFDFVTKDRRALYRLGPKLVELGTASRRNFSVRKIIRRIAEPMIEEAGICCLVGQVVEADVGIVVIDRIIPTQKHDILTAPIGELYPMTAPAMGRLVLATRPFEESISIWRTLAGRDSVREDEMRSSFESIRARGYATSIHEYQIGVNAVATSVRGEHGGIVAVLCLIGYEQHLPPDQLDHWGKQLVSTATRLAYEINHPSLNQSETTA